MSDSSGSAVRRRGARLTRAAAAPLASRVCSARARPRRRDGWGQSKLEAAPTGCLQRTGRDCARVGACARIRLPAAPPDPEPRGGRARRSRGSTRIRSAGSESVPPDSRAPCRDTVTARALGAAYSEREGDAGREQGGRDPADQHVPASRAALGCLLQRAGGAPAGGRREALQLAGGGRRSSGRRSSSSSHGGGTPRGLG